MKIIMYHYIRDFNLLENKGINGLDVSKFESQIKYLLTKYNILDPHEIHKIVENKDFFKENDCWLTFDDGYKDHYQHVLPILEKYEIKASFFPPVETTMQNIILDVNKIHFILANCDNKKTIMEKIKKNYTFLDADNTLENFEEVIDKNMFKSRYDDNLTKLIKQLLQTVLPHAIRTKICDDLFKEYVTEDTVSFVKKLYMNISQVKEIYNLGHEIGLHGFNHFWLGHLSEKDQRNEILGALEFWKENGIIKDKFTMCYPYGSYNNDTLEILKNNNCIVGLTTTTKSVELENYSPYELPRYDTNDFPQI